MAVQISSYRPRMRLDNPASVYFPAQTVGGSSISESFTVPPPVSQRPQGPALVPGVAPPSKSGSVNASSGATGPPGSFDGRRMRSKSTSRRTVDYNASLINYVQVSQHLLLNRDVKLGLKKKRWLVCYNRLITTDRFLVWCYWAVYRNKPVISGGR